MYPSNHVSPSMHSGETGFWFGNLDSARTLARLRPLTCCVVER
jgi:hypothetical protein